MLAEFDLLLAAGDLFPDRFVGVEIATLVEISEFDGLTDADGAAVRLLLAGNHAKEGRFAGAVRADDADDAAGGEAEGHVFDEEFVPVGLAHPFGFDNDVAEAGAGGDEEFEFLFLLLAFLTEEFFIGRDTRLTLGVAPLWTHANPFEFALQGLLALSFRFVFLAEAVLFLLQPRRIVSFPGDAGAAVEFENPAGDIVEEVAVMGDGDDGAGILLQVEFEPGDRFGIEMVGRLIQKEDVGFLQQKAAKSDAALFAAGEDSHLGVGRRAAQGVHCQFEAGIEVPGIEVVELFLDHGLAVAELLHIGIRIGKGGVDLFELLEQIDGFLHPFLDDFTHGLGAIDQRFLFEIADGVAGGKDGLTGEVFIDAGKNTQQRTLARAVEAEDADLGAVIVRKVDILEDRLFVVKFVDSDHRVNNLGIDTHRFILPPAKKLGCVKSCIF